MQCYWLEVVLPHVICERRVLREKGKEGGREGRKRGGRRKERRKSPFRPTVILGDFQNISFLREKKENLPQTFTSLFQYSTISVAIEY